MEIIQKELQRSNLYHELKWKYLERKLKPIVFATIAVWVLAIAMEIWKLGVLQTRPIVHL